MDKIATGPIEKDLVDLDFSLKKNVSNLADFLNKDLSSLTVCILDRPRHKKIIDKLNRHKVDLVVLAGWMRIVTPRLINAFPNKIINIHPSLLPKYKGLNAVKQALDSGDKITGCTVHYVTEELDSGGCIDSSSVLICAGDTEETLHHRVQRAEHRLLPMVINNLFGNIN